MLMLVGCRILMMIADSSLLTINFAKAWFYSSVAGLCIVLIILDLILMHYAVNIYTFDGNNYVALPQFIPFDNALAYFIGNISILGLVTTISYRLLRNYFSSKTNA